MCWWCGVAHQLPMVAIQSKPIFHSIRINGKKLMLNSKKISFLSLQSVGGLLFIAVRIYLRLSKRFWRLVYSLNLFISCWYSQNYNDNHCQHVKKFLPPTWQTHDTPQTSPRQRQRSSLVQFGIPPLHRPVAQSCTQSQLQQDLLHSHH